MNGYPGAGVFVCSSRFFKKPPGQAWQRQRPDRYPGAAHLVCAAHFLKMGCSPAGATRPSDVCSVTKSRRKRRQQPQRGRGAGSRRRPRFRGSFVVRVAGSRRKEPPTEQVSGFSCYAFCCLLSQVFGYVLTFWVICDTIKLYRKRRRWNCSSKRRGKSLLKLL